jgi:hypothetical protein
MTYINKGLRGEDGTPRAGHFARDGLLRIGGGQDVEPTEEPVRVRRPQRRDSGFVEGNGPDIRNHQGVPFGFAPRPAPAPQPAPAPSPEIGPRTGAISRTGAVSGALWDGGANSGPILGGANSGPIWVPPSSSGGGANSGPIWVAPSPEIDPRTGDYAGGSGDFRRM